jgi:hypothetical protein
MGVKAARDYWDPSTGPASCGPLAVDADDRALWTAAMIRSATSRGGSCSQNRSTVHPSHLSVALHVARELRDPVVGVRLRQVQVLRAAVPEAPVDEDGDALAGEGDVCTAPRLLDHAVVDAIPHSLRVKELPNSQLRPRVAPSVRSHDAACCVRRGP